LLLLLLLLLLQLYNLWFTKHMAAAVLPQLPKGSEQGSDAKPLVVNAVTPGFVPTTGALS
jgi:hypothetical protein